MTKPNEQSLEPLAPTEAIAFYKDDRRQEVSEATLQSHGYRLHNFVRWCDQEEIENLNNIGGRDIQRFKKWRSEQVNIVTLKSQMDTLRVFLRFCESIDGVRDGVADSVRSPSLERADVRDKDIVRERKANAILPYLDKPYGHYSHRRRTWGRTADWRTRIGVRHIAARVIDNGQSPSYVADQLNVSLEDVYDALSYYYTHLEEMREVEKENKAAFERFESLR